MQNVVDLQHLSDFSDRVRNCALPHAPRGQRGRDIGTGIHMGKERKVLKRHPDPAIFGLDPIHILAMNGNLPCIGFDHPCNQTQQNGFPCARWPEQHKRLARVNAETDIIENGLSLEAFDDIIENQTHVLILSPRQG